MTTVYVPDVILEVRKLALANPEHVYQRPGGGPCKYVVDGAGSCIVGQALLAVGVDPDEIHSYEYKFASVALKALGCSSDWKSLYWLDVVQIRQDTGHTWKDAVATADLVATTIFS